MIKSKKTILIIAFITFILLYFRGCIFYGHSSTPIKLTEIDFFIVDKKLLSNSWGYAGMFYNKKDTLFEFCHQDTLVNDKHTFNYNISCWKFIDKTHFNNQDLVFSKKIPKYFVRSECEIFSPNSTRAKNVRYGCDFKKNMTVSIDQSDSVIKQTSGRYYKTITGYFEQIMISDEDKPQIYIPNLHYSDKPSTIILYKKFSTLYFILITSEYKYDSDSVVEIFNLN